MANEGAALSDLSGKTIAGRYKVIKQLGEGGQSQVYVAVQEPLGRKVALKVIRGEWAGDPDQVERFEREARTISELQHPHIIPIYDLGRDEGMLYMTMELVKGRSLDKRLLNGDPIPLGASIQIVRDVAQGLDAAHRRGVVHRDLKPANVMLVSDAGRPEYVKILDFGIAKKQTEMRNVTMAGMIVGTPGYMAPEVATAATFDGRADLYALGVMWYEMLTGQPMFTAQTPLSLVMRHATEVPPPFTSIGVDVPPEIEQLIFSLVAKNPDDRPATAQALIAKLDTLGFTTNPGALIPARPAPVDVATVGAGGAGAAAAAGAVAAAHGATAQLTPVNPAPAKFGTVPGAASGSVWPGSPSSSPSPSQPSPPQPSSPPNAPAFSSAPDAPAFAQSSSASSSSSSAGAGPGSPSAPAFAKAPDAPAFGGGAAFQPPSTPAPKAKSGGFAGCLKIGCIIGAVVGVGGVVLLLWGGNWIRHLAKKQNPRPPATAPAPAPAPPARPGVRPPAQPTRPPVQPIRPPSQPPRPAQPAPRQR